MIRRDIQAESQEEKKKSRLKKAYGKKVRKCEWRLKIVDELKAKKTKSEADS